MQLLIMTVLLLCSLFVCIAIKKTFYFSIRIYNFFNKLKSTFHINFLYSLKLYSNKISYENLKKSNKENLVNVHSIETLNGILLVRLLAIFAHAQDLR